MTHPPLSHPVFDVVAKAAAEEGIRCFVIGGYVRDFFLKRPSKDADFVVLGDGVAFAEKVATKLGVRVNVFKKFGTAVLNFEGWDFEFVGARKESYRSESRKPKVELGTLEDDQNRRDFTINAMAFGLGEKEFGELTDPFNGMQDLNDGIIRTPLEPGITFSDDPLRMMRAIRFATQLNFTIHPETLEGIKANAHRLDIISAERITDELNKIILSPNPSIGFKLLFDTKLLHRFFPELVAMQGVETIRGKSHKDNFYHTLQVLDQICEMTGNLWLRWAAIMHDIAKPLTKRFEPEGFTFHGHEDKGSRMVKPIFRRMKLPLDEKMEYVSKLVMLHLRPKALAESPQSTDSGYRRLIVDAGEDAEDLFTLCRADITSKNKQKVELYRKNLEDVRQMMNEVAERDDLRNWQPPVDGLDIMNAFGIGPGRQIGIIKNIIREAILEGDIPNQRDPAVKLMVTTGLELGLALMKKLN
ncbi:MAG: HD domain-containing protein [Flavobacteriaceae bacterium]|nr:HD domain-containing protein [Flavobacteriaceae bacterium]